MLGLTPPRTSSPHALSQPQPLPAPLPPEVDRHRFSIADFHRLAEAGILTENTRVELIKGKLIDMAPIGSRHGGLVNRLARLRFVTVGRSAIVSIQDPVVLAPHSQPRPDLALLRLRADDDMDSHPTAADVWLIVEVADSTLAYDCTIKLPLYARHGIPEVWLIDAATRRLLRDQQPKDSLWQSSDELSAQDSVAPLMLPGQTLRLAELFR